MPKEWFRWSAGGILLAIAMAALALAPLVRPADAAAVAREHPCSASSLREARTTYLMAARALQRARAATPGRRVAGRVPRIPRRASAVTLTRRTVKMLARTRIVLRLNAARAGLGLRPFKVPRVRVPNARRACARATLRAHRRAATRALRQGSLVARRISRPEARVSVPRPRSAPAPGRSPAPPPAPPPATPEPDDGLRVGLHQDLTYDGHARRRELALTAATEMGAAVSRNSLMWDKIEPTRGDRDWSRVDAVVNELEAARIEPFFTLYGAPSWVNGVPLSTPDHQLHVPRGAAFDEWVSALAGFAGDAASRYRDRVDLYEVWNEPNEHWFWKPTPDIDRYLALFDAVEAAILAEDPSAKVAIGGVTGLSASGPDDIVGTSFLQGLIDRGLAISYVGIHPYAMRQHAPDVDIAWNNNFTDIGDARALLDDAGLGHVPLWVSEWGWKADQVGEATQAAYVARSLEMLRDGYPSVTVATYFIDYDRPTYSEGLLREDFSRRPAGDEFAAFTASLPD